MAIIFTKDIATDKLLLAYNNNIVRFQSNTVNVPSNAEITGLGIDVVLYPHPDGIFYFNFKDYIKSEINTKNFADDLVYNLVNADPETFTYDVSDGCYLEGIIQFKINFLIGGNETVERNLKFIAGAEQVEDFKKGQTISDGAIVIISPVVPGTNNSNYIKYWEGYPFELSFYNTEINPFTLKNNSNGLDFEFTSKAKINSLFLSDGRTDVTLEDFLPLNIGQNYIQFIVDDVNQNVNLIIDKADSDCGVYVKFLNKYGRWSYWLFSKNHYRNRNSKYLTEIENDFSNLEDTMSPTLQIGKSGDETLTCAAEKLNENEKVILEGIIDSPKIYLFTGERFSKAELSDWVEVRLKTQSFKTLDAKRKRYTYVMELDFPARNTQTL